MKSTNIILEQLKKRFDEDDLVDYMDGSLFDDYEQIAFRIGYDIMCGKDINDVNLHGDSVEFHINTLSHMTQRYDVFNDVERSIINDMICNLYPYVRSKLTMTNKYSEEYIDKLFNAREMIHRDCGFICDEHFPHCEYCPLHDEEQGGCLVGTAEKSIEKLVAILVSTVAKGEP